VAFVDPTGLGFWSKFFGAIVGIFVTVVTGGCVPCGVAAFSFTDTMIASLQAGVSFGRSLGLAATNAAISGLAAAAAPVIGAPAAFAAAGALQGVADAAILGADVGHAAWVGAIAGLTTYVAGPIIGGGVASTLNGGSFGRGAAEGAYSVAAVLAIAYTSQAVAQGKHDTQPTYKLTAKAQRGETKGGGHTWVTFEDSAGNQRSVGFWPQPKTVRNVLDAVLGVPGWLRRASGPLDHPSGKVDAFHTWTITQAQFDSATAYIQGYENTQWSLCVNCTTFVIGVLQAAGVSVPDGLTTYGFPDPNKLADWLDSLPK